MNSRLGVITALAVGRLAHRSDGLDLFLHSIDQRLDDVMDCVRVACGLRAGRSQKALVRAKRCALQGVHA